MNPIFFSIWNIDIYWYSIIILIGLFLGFFFAIKEAKRMNIPQDFLFNLLFWTVIFGVIGARLYYVLFNWDYYAIDLTEIFKTWNGGLAIHGGLIAGFITVIVYTRKYKVNSFKFTDIMVVSLLLSQAIGRWGNFFNKEAHGLPTTISHLKNIGIPNFVIKGMKIDGIYYTPTFLYESLWCLVGFIILLFVRRYKYIKTGQLTCLYSVWYGVGRFLIETSRTDSLMFGGFKQAQIISMLMIVMGLVVFMILWRKDKYIDLYNEERSY